ncbi:MAG: DUF4175 domain-containing protein [Bacteroidetes bacterium]|nr:DUF4175 domain-containing protein [Bacteroidota bacterium]
MSTAENNYRELLEKLDAFIRKYYTNQLIKGGIYAFALLLGFYLAVTLLESFAWFSPAVRSVLFYTYLAATAVVLWKLVLTPLFKLYKLGNTLSRNDAAKIIGEHFQPIRDKLLNTLQLHDQANAEPEHLALIHASINQKSAELRPIPFSSAIDLRKNRKYLPYAAFPLLALVIILFAAPSLITDPTRRLLEHGKSFSRPAPFSFQVTNDKLQVVQFEDFTIDVKMDGKEIPAEVFVEIGNNTFRLEKENLTDFHYTFRNVQGNTDFRLVADGFFSDDFLLNAVPNPVMVDFTVELDYPAYLGRKNEVIKNTGDLLVPAGTRATWNIGTQNTSELRIRFTDSTYALREAENNRYTFKRRLQSSSSYAISTGNKFLQSKDSVAYTINVIPDQYPLIEVEEQKDSASYQRIYFRGMVQDDYGLSKLQFRYRFLKREGESVNEEAIAAAISFNKGLSQDQFFHFWDLGAVSLKAGDELEYYFEVWDNDGVQGPKSARSVSNVFKAPSLQELAKENESQNKALKEDMSESIKKAKELQKALNDLHKDLLNKKNLDYEDRKKVSDILKQQKELEKKVEEIQKQQSLNKQQQNELRAPDPQLAEKQKQLEELFEKLMTPEMKKMMEELEKMMAQIDKQKLQETMEQMKLDNKDLEKQLDRTLELFKQMELEQKMKETAENLEKLAEDQEKLAEKNDEKGSESEKLKEEQKELNKEFEDIKKNIDDIEKKNEELEYSQEMKDFDKEQEEISEEMEKSEQELSQGQKKSAKKKQKQAAEKMKELSQKIKQQQKEKEEEQNEEDMQAMRALLENLLRFSFDQEKLLEEAKGIDINNPRYLKLAQEQRKLKDDAKVLEDSLLALSKRVIQIASSVNEQITDINNNTEKALANLQDRQVPQARANQQFIMTAVNNLALMLSESLDQMQQQMSQNMPSNSSCKKPGQGKPKPGPNAGDIKKMQEKLGQQLKEMKEKMQQGQKPGGKPGQGMSEELARMAAQQEALRNALNQLNQQENKDAQGKLGDLGKIAEQMEQNEKDIVNKRITELTIKRQQEILTRLLESEKAEREREQEERRESNEARDIYRTPPQFEDFKKLKIRENELLKSIPPGFSTFYKNLVNTYFQNLQN